MKSTSTRITASTISHAAAALERLLDFGQAADTALSAFFRERRGLGQRERRLIAEIVYAVLRRKRYLEKLLDSKVTPRRLVLAALARLIDDFGSGLIGCVDAEEAAWLSALQAMPDPELTLAEQADLPDWLIDRLLAAMPADALLRLAGGLNQSAPLDIRVNTLKAARGEVLARLAADGLTAQPCRYSPLGIRLADKPALARHPLYLDGAIEVQDEGSQLLGYLLAPKRGETVVDFCAGAGGKTLLLGAMMRSSGRLYAFDVADRRLARLKPRAARADLSNVQPMRISGEHDARVTRLAGKVDRVLVDAPCSGLGTQRRNPDLKWRQSAQSVGELAKKQGEILAGASRLVKPGGRLVYATCSILREENEAVTDAFLVAHPDFRPLSAVSLLAAQDIVIDCGEAMQLAPDRHGTDAFYALAMERRP